MLIIDWVILAVVGISALISVKRGFVKEMMSLELARGVCYSTSIQWAFGCLANRCH